MLQRTNGHLPTDLLAGLTVALVGLPQCIAYALMSGLPPAYGLSTAAVAGLIAAIAGKSAQVITGPTNTTGLLILGALAAYLAPNGLLMPTAVATLATLTLLAGAVRIVGAFLGGAHLIRLIPESVLIGFTAGAAILIGVMQLDEALGLPPVRATGLLSEIGIITTLIAEVRWPAVVFAAVTIAIATLGPRYLPRAPYALIAVLATTVIAAIARLENLPLVRDLGVSTSGWPPLALPALDPGVLQSFIVPAIAIALLGTLELAVTARSGGERPDMRREILAQGWGNVAAAFAGAFPASASLARSALLKGTGATTRVAAAVAAIVTGAFLLVGGDLAGWIPQATLAGILLVIAARMIDWNAIRRLWNASTETRLLFVETFVATLILPLHWAILLGAGTALVIHIMRTSSPRVRALRPEGDDLVPLQPGERSDVVVIEVSGNLHYAAVAPFLDEVEQMIPPSARAVIIDLSHAHELRFAALRALEQLAEELRHDGATLWLAGVDADTASLLERSESKLQWIAEDATPGLSVRRVIERL